MLLTPAIQDLNPCSSCDHFPECTEPTKGFEDCGKTIVVKRGQGCWDGENFGTYIPCSECSTRFSNYEFCRSIRESEYLFLKFEEDFKIYNGGF